MKSALSVRMEGWELSPTWRGDEDLTADTVCYCGARNAKREHNQASNNVYASPHPKSTVRTDCWRPLEAPKNFGRFELRDGSELK
jgi:hypothetical protein